MRPRWQKISSDFFSHRVRSVLVIASIAVGLFAIGMITTSYVILAHDIRTGYRAVNPANIQVSSSPFSEDFLEHIRNQPGVSSAEGTWNTSLQVKTKAGEWKVLSIKAQNIGDDPGKTIGIPRLLEGSWPPADKEIALDMNKLDDTGARLGDVLEIRLPSGVIRNMQLTGIVQDQTIGSDRGEGGFFLSNIQGYVTLDTLPWLEQVEAYNTLYVTTPGSNEDKQAIQKIADRLTEQFTQHGYMVSSTVVRLSDQHPNLVYVDAMAAVIYLLGFLVVFLSGFLITNTFSALLNQQVQQIGVMKTFGASRRQIIFMYMVLILVYSLIALLVAIPLSEQAAFALLEYIAGRINLHVEGLRRVPVSTVLQVIVALVVPQLAGILPILQGTRISVREALSGNTTAVVDNKGFFFRIAARLRGLSRPLLISLRNTFRRRWRLLLTLITLTLGGATFIATFNVRNSLEIYIDKLSRYFLADVNLTLEEPYRLERVIHDVKEVPGVLAVEGWAGAVASVASQAGQEGEAVRLVAPPADSHLTEPLLLEGRWLDAEDQNAIVLSELFLDNYPNLRVGDTIRLKIGLAESDWVIVGFFQFAGRNTGLMAYTNYDDFTRQVGMYGRAFSYRIVGVGEPLSLQQQEELAGRIESHLTALDYKINNVGTGLYLQETTSQGLNILTTFLLIMSFLLASVGSIGLAGTMSLNVMERTQEIGVMRAIGGSNRAIISIVLVEGILIGLISWLLSGLAALAISKQLADVMFQIIFDRGADMAFTTTGNLIWLGIVLVLSMLASVLPAYNASRLTIREVLAYE